MKCNYIIGNTNLEFFCSFRNDFLFFILGFSFQVSFNQVDYLHFVPNMLDHTLFYIFTHIVPVLFEYHFGSIDFFNPKFVVVKTLIENFVFVLLRVGKV